MIIDFKNLGIAKESDGWNGNYEIKLSDIADLKLICAWYDADNSNVKASYKLPHHKQSDKKAVWRGVSAAMAALLGARGNANIPEGDKQGVYNHLADHYKQFDKELPEMNRSFEVSKETREERFYNIKEFRINNIPETNEPIIEGYASVFDQFSEDLGGFIEKVNRGAFKKTLKEADIRALFNHDPNYVLGRNKAGTLDLEEDDKGLKIKIKPPRTQWANDLIESMRRGDIDQMSFGFRIIDDAWYEQDNKIVRELREVALLDVSPVTYPAYPQTEVNVRASDKYSKLLLKIEKRIELNENDKKELENIKQDVLYYNKEQNKIIVDDLALKQKKLDCLEAAAQARIKQNKD